MGIANKQGFTLGMIVLGLSMSAASQVQAAPHAHHADARIEQGRASGELTGREAARLNGEKRALRTEKQAYKADGVVSAAERKDLRQDAARLDRDIYNQKHDAQTAGNNPVPVAARDPGVNQRQRNQRGRIAQGLRSGELTKSEAQTLGSEQKAIRQEERAYKADGVLTKAERRDLHQDQNAASKDVYQQKHDADKRE